MENIHKLLKNIFTDIHSKCNKIIDYHLKHGYSIFKSTVGTLHIVGT